jgi:hypothetical protein
MAKRPIELWSGCDAILEFRMPTEAEGNHLATSSLIGH